MQWNLTTVNIFFPQLSQLFAVVVITDLKWTVYSNDSIIYSIDTVSTLQLSELTGQWILLAILNKKLFRLHDLNYLFYNWKENDWLLFYLAIHMYFFRLIREERLNIRLSWNSRSWEDNWYEQLLNGWSIFRSLVNYK